MIEDSKTIFITHPYFAVNNPTNNYRIYKKNKNSNQWYYIQCKDKEEYAKKLKEYVGGFLDYSRDENKAQTSLKDYVVSDNSSLFDYFMGGKKEQHIMDENQMKREEMAMLKNGEFLLDKDVPKINKRWMNYIDNSNIQMTVLSFNQDYIDSNIDIKDLQKKLATNIMPKFLNYCGYKNPKENLEWIVSLHSDRENNYHFHISWIEKNKCYMDEQGKLSHRIKLLLSENETNFIKRQAVLEVERNKLYRPALIELEKDIQHLKKYFNPKDMNFTLKNIKNIKLEEDIIKLGFMLEQIKNTNRKYIKYNSLPRNEEGKSIKKLTNKIKTELFKNPQLKKNKDKIFDSINKINDILLDIDKRNNISKEGYEEILNNKMIQNKLDKTDTYILNAIVNHALYNMNHYKRKIKKDNFTLEDIITQIAYRAYIDDCKKINIKKFKIKMVENFFSGKTYKTEIDKAIDRLIYRQENIAHKFYEMFEEEKNEGEKIYD